MARDLGSINNIQTPSQSSGGRVLGTASPQMSSQGYSPAPQQTQAPSLSDSIWSSIVGAGKNIGSDIQNAGNAVNADISNTQQNPVVSGFRAASDAASAIPNVTADLIPKGKSILGAVGKGFQAAVQAPSNLANSLSELGASQNQINQKQINAGNFTNSSAGKAVGSVADIGNSAGNIASTILGAQGAAESLKNIGYGAKNAFDVANAPVTEQPQVSQIDPQKVTDLYNRAIKPSVAGKTTAGAINKANSQAVTGLTAIADNKPNLSFTNAEGETLANATPKTVDQLSQAIQQTKSSIFNQYDSLAKQAGEQGVTVDGTKIGVELQPVIDSKSLQLANPQAVDYAKSVQDRFNQAGGIDAQTAQDVIQHYNDSLKAYYRNPGYETASKAGVDALIANKLREQLDKGISGATGEQYQALKNQYGALSSIEKDVARRNVVWGRQNSVGLAGNLANISSGAELARGLITMNPADIGASLAIKGVQKYMQYLNNPDVGVSKIFSHLNETSRPSTGSTQGLGAIGK